MAEKPLGLIIFSTAYSIEEIGKYKLAVFHSSKNPQNYFSMCLVINPLAFSHNQNRNDKNSFGIKRAQIADSVFQVDIIKNDHQKKFKLLSLNIVVFKVILEIVLFLRKYNVPIIRGDDALLSGILALILSRISRKRTLLAYWGNTKRIRRDTGLPIMKRLFKSFEREERMEKRVLQRAHLVVTENHDNKVAAMDSGCSSDKIRVIGLGGTINASHMVNLSQRLPIKDAQINRKTLDFTNSWLCISRLEPVKKVQDLIVIQSYVIESIPNSILCIIGEGSQFTELKNLVSKLSLDNNVFFLGYRDQEWISNFAPNFCLQAAPLSGRSLLELALAGLPAVAYDIDWHSEIVKPEQTGFLVEPGDVKSFANSVIYLLQNENKRELFSSNILRLARNKVLLEQKSNITNLYNEIIAKC